MTKILGVAALLGLVAAQNTALPTVDLGYEVYRATGFNSSGNFYNFSNIRYAAPPLGNLRFAPPQAPAKDRSAINNGTTNRICVQGSPKWQDLAAQVLASQAIGLNISNINFSIPPANASSPVSRPDPRESEDCLFLDVFVPESVLNRKGYGKGAAVLVWIYGGGYTGGSKNTNPAGLIAASGNATNGDIIFVSLNYRLGAFGWLSGPSFQAEGGTSNAALYDQRFALEWIQKHIHLFGGDKDRVTVIGESAGGGSIMHQITAYGGLKGKVPFAQAVPQSPGWLPIQNNVQQEDIYQKFLNLTNSTSLADLRRLPTEALIRANAQQIGYDSAWGTFTYGPVVDGVFAPLQPGQLLAQGRFDKSVKVMVGHNANEGALFTPPYLQSDASVQAQIKNAYPYAPQKSLDYITKTLYPPVFNGSYPYRDQYTRSSLIVAESSFTCNTRYLSTAYGNQTYSYLFAVPPALHGQDVSYTFFTGGTASPANALGVQNRTVAIALQKFITSFTETGIPAADGIRQFNMYGPDAAVLKLNITSIDEVRDSNANARCAWWQKALY